jgi:hypothetical protein
VVTPDCFDEVADGSSLYSPEGLSLRLFLSSSLSMLQIFIYFCFFIAHFLLVKLTRKISYNRNPVEYFELLYFLYHFYEVLECDMECDTLSISNYFIFCLIFMNYFIFCLIFMKYLNLGTCQKNEILSQKHAKKLRILEMPILRFTCCFDLQPKHYLNNCSYHINSNS